MLFKGQNDKLDKVIFITSRQNPRQFYVYNRTTYRAIRYTPCYEKVKGKINQAAAKEESERAVAVLTEYVEFDKDVYNACGIQEPVFYTEN